MLIKARRLKALTEELGNLPAEACKDVDQLLWSLNDLSITVTTRGAATDDEKKWTLEQKDKFFTGLGAHAELLPVLRTDDIVQNMRLSKGDAETMLHDIWKAKEQYDSVQSARSSLLSFLQIYFHQRFLSPKAMTEWCYSFIACLDKYIFDADFSQFRCILLGEVLEDLHWDERDMLDRLMEWLHDLDEMVHPDDPQGMVPRGVLVANLADFWPNKSKHALQKLSSALRKDLGKAKVVVIDKLFEETADGCQTCFIEEACRRPSLREHGRSGARCEAQSRADALQSNVLRATLCASPSIGSVHCGPREPKSRAV